MVIATNVDPRDSQAKILLPSLNVLPEQKISAKSETVLESKTKLSILSRAAKCRLTGIVCTIGPVSKPVSMLTNMLYTGMCIARMNFSHGSHEYHAETIKNVREAAQVYAKTKGYKPHVSIALDTKGPEIRTGLLEGDDGRLEVEMTSGAKVKITTNDDLKEKCTKDVIWVDYKNITKVLVPGGRIYIDDGLISVVADEIGADWILGTIENGGRLGSRKGCNLPGTNTDLPAVSEKDKADLIFGIEQGVDMIFASFIRDAAGVHTIRNILKSKTDKNILIISKIENQEGVANIDEIIAASDGIMVARGDMGIEIPAEKVFIAQKQIIAKCNQAGKPVICATQMLESMVKKPRPTRAEVSDVANAVLDGADCVMLSGETAKGDYVIQCISTMAAISREAESCLWNERFFRDLISNQLVNNENDIMTSVVIAAVQASYNVNAAAIATITNTGHTAHMLSKFRPKCPILTVTRFEQVARQLNLYRGIYPILHEDPMLEDRNEDVEKRMKLAVQYGKEFNILLSGDNIICVTGWKKGPGSTNTIKIVRVDENV